MQKRIGAALVCAAVVGGAFLCGAGVPPAAAQEQKAKESTGKVGEILPDVQAKVMVPAKPGDTAGDKEVALQTTKNPATTVYVLVGVTCPATKPYSERLVALEQAYMGKGVDFVYVYVNKPEPAEMKAKFHKEQKFAGKFWNDADSSFARKIKASKTGEVLIADKEGKVLFRGGIDDNLNDPSKVKQRFVAAALDEILAGKPVTMTTGNVFG